MRRTLLIAVGMILSMTAWAQNIAVVSPSNTTTIYKTLEEAIAGAESGSTIYLPGGGIQISDETKINKKLTIMGVSHRGDTDNVDGATIVSGNLHFEGGSSGSAILGIFVSGDINVGTETDPVTNFTVRYCNVNSIQVKNSQSSEMVVNQSYLRNTSNFGDSNAKITNCVVHSIRNVNCGQILYNNILKTSWYPWGLYNGRAEPLEYIYNCIISKNIFENPINWFYAGNNEGYNNYGDYRFDDSINIEASINDLFVWYDGGDISPAYKFRFKDEYKQYENQVGIYGGSGFKDDKSLAPIPRIISKKVADCTDESGKLQIIVKVKAQ